MMRLVRVLLLGAVAIGIMLALTAAPSSGGARGQTGYGDDTVPPRQIETAIGEQAGSGGGDDGSNTMLVLIIGGLVIVLGGGAAFAYSRSHS